MKYEGAVTEINLLEKLLELANEKFTGAIRFENDAIIKIIYFKGGEVLSASTNDRSDSIDEILLKSNKVSREHIKQALAKRKESETLGDALLNLGFISKKELAWVRRIQLIGIMRSLIRWPEGTYTIVSDYLPKREEGTSFQLPQIVVEMIVTDEERSSVETELQGGAAVFDLHPDAFERYQELGLNEDADAIFASIDGRKSVSEIAGNSAMDAFSVYKLIRAFLLLGLIRHANEKPKETLEVSPASTGLSDWSLEDYEEPPAPALAGLPPVKPKTIEVPADEELLPSIDLGPIGEEGAETPAPEPTVKMPSWDMKTKPAMRGGTTPGVIPTPPMRSTAPGSQRASAPTFATATPKKRKSSSKLPFVILAIVLLAAAGYGAWWWLNRPQPATVATAKRPVPKAAPGVIEEAPVPAPVVSTDTEATDTVMAPLPAPVLTTAPATTPTAVAAPVIAAPASPAVTPPTGSRDPKRAQFEAQARDYAAESASTRFAVQLAAVCEVSSLETSLSRGGASVWFVPAQIGNRSCFRVLWGRYPDRASANRGLSELPQFFRSGRPVVVEVSSVVKR